MGLRTIKGLKKVDGQRIAEAGPFVDMADFVLRTELDEGSLESLAAAGAFAGFGLDRRDALWAVRGLRRGVRPSLDVEDGEREAHFRPLGLLETIAWDLDRSGHSTRGHPLGALRNELQALGLPDARGVAAVPSGETVHYAGIVICRQRPGTASGVTFLTLEDETGFVNLILWKRVYERYRLLAKTSSLLGVTGKVEKEDGVVHLIADALWTPRLSRSPRKRPSRDFH